MLFLILGVVLLVFAIVAFILAWGFLKGKKWAWWLGVIFSVLQIISGAFAANLRCQQDPLHRDRSSSWCT